MLALLPPIRDRKSILGALWMSQAIIEFRMDGTVLDANALFLQLFGYTLDEIKGRHHALFLPPNERETPEYAAFWATLRSGQTCTAEYRRIAKGHREVWVQATYIPVPGLVGTPGRIVKFASDITADKLRSIDQNSMVEAIGLSQAVAELALDGTILEVNAKFCRAFGYQQAELRGRHHSVLVSPDYRRSDAYALFWSRLQAGEYQQAEYRRIAKDGRDVWIQASYNPVIDPFGRLLKIVKFATDVTAAKLRAIDDNGKIAAIAKSQTILELAPDGMIITANRNFLAAFGYSLEEVAGRHHRMLVRPGEWDSQAYESFWHALRAGAYQIGEFRRVGRNGRAVWLHASYNPIVDPEGKLIKIVKFATDITREVAQREDVRLLSLVANETSNSVVITDSDGNVEFVNSGFTRMTGYTLADVHGRKPGEVLQGPDTSLEHRQRFRQMLKLQLPFCEEILNYTKDGQPYWVSVFVNPVCDEDGNISRFVSIQSNVTDRKTAEARAAHMARHDPLTGLPNRTLFDERLTTAIGAGSSFALLYLDLDHFKPVNDALGHQAGDELLRQVADRLRAGLRGSDTAARLGGDEFAVIHQPAASRSEVEQAAAHFIELIRAPYVVGGQPVAIGVSIGAAIMQGQDIGPDCLIAQADRALYRAKGAGRGTLCLIEADEAPVPAMQALA